MADIALFVAEEFMERSSLVGARGRAELNAAPRLPVLACRVQQLPLMEVGRKVSELAKKALEPKSQLGLLASDGFFSA